MKPMNDVLDGLRLTSTVFSRMTLAGNWGFSKERLQGAPFHMLLQGRAVLRTEDNSEHELQAGDIAILPRGNRHHLLANQTAKAVPWANVVHEMGWAHWTPGARFKTVDFRYGTGDSSTHLISGVFAFEDPRRNPLLAALPSVMVVRASDDSAAAKAIQKIAAMLEIELKAGSAGAESVAGRLADILFIHVVRHHLLIGDDLPPGWLLGMRDKQVGPALALIHSAPEQPWSVAALASAVGMSRSRFAARFGEVVGQAPVEYLTQWRMYRAAGALAEGQTAIATLAASVGYRSAIAFSKAFKRWAGRSPVEYRRWLLSSRDLGGNKASTCPST